MQWLVPSVIATMTGTVILTLCYFYLYTQDKKAYLKIWAISWGIYFTRYIFLLAMLLWQKNDWLLIGNQLSTLISGTLLLYGTYIFIEKKFPRPFLYLSGICAVWIFISVLNHFPFMVMSLPTFSFLAFIYIWTGYIFYKHSKSAQKEASIVGVTFIAWGIHKANYPFLQPVVWFAPWGYLIAAMLEFLTALGLIIVYFRKTKDESQVAENRYRGLFDSIRDAILVSDTERSIIECNPAFTELFGYTKNEIKGKKTRYLYENDAQFVELGESLKEHHGKKHFLETVNYKKKDGQIFPGETGVYYLKNIQSEVIGFIGLIRDISDRRKAEETLEKQNYYLEKAQDLSQIGTWELDIINSRLFWTDETCRIFGVPEGNLVDYETFISKVHPDDRDFVNEKWEAGIEGNPYDIEHRLLLDGEVKWIREKADITFDDNGKAISAIGFAQDITERKQLENRLQQSQKMESIGQLAGGIAHDFNNLLYPIIGYAEMLKEDLPMDSPEHESAQEIYNAGKRGGELVKQILAFSRQDEKKLQPIRVQKILKDVLKLTRSSIPTDIEIHHDIQQDCGSVMADPTQLHQIGMNLITNAYHAVEKAGGKISVQFKEIMMDAGELKDSSLKPGQYAMLSISDNGSGIPGNVINNIFEPYFTTKEKGKGTGLGLAVVYGIVKEHKGDIKVYSEEGKGTTFNVYIPLIKKLLKPLQMIVY